MWHTDFYTRCLQSSTTINDAAGYGVTIEPVTVQPGDVYYKIIGIHHLTGPENGFNHHLYADVLDEQGRRIDRAELTVENFNGALGRLVADKQATEPGTNHPIWPNDRLSVWAGWKEEGRPAPLPSDKAHGFHTLHPDEGPLNRTAHHSFYLVFQRTIATGQQPPVDPEPPVTAHEIVIRIGDKTIHTADTTVVLTLGAVHTVQVAGQLVEALPEDIVITVEVVAL